MKQKGEKKHDVTEINDVKINDVTQINDVTKNNVKDDVTKFGDVNEDVYDEVAGDDVIERVSFPPVPSFI